MAASAIPTKVGDAPVQADANLAAAADVNAAVAAAAGLRLMGVSAREAAGEAAAASFAVVHGATAGGGTPVVVFELGQNASVQTWYGPGGIAVPNGLSLDVTAGTVDVILHYLTA